VGRGVYENKCLYKRLNLYLGDLAGIYVHKRCIRMKTLTFSDSLNSAGWVGVLIFLFRRLYKLQYLVNYDFSDYVRPGLNIVLCISSRMYLSDEN
jgi:hypothetical protein